MAIDRRTATDARATVRNPSREDISDLTETGAARVEEASLKQKEQSRLMFTMAKATADAHEQVFALKADLAQAREIVRAEINAETAALRDRIAELEAECRALRQSQAATPDISEALRHELEKQRSRADHFEAWTNALLSSTSWRITGPLRSIVRVFRA